jgi:polysaccharide deacetylase family protein (PEP-CTERM system associated)
MRNVLSFDVEEWHQSFFFKEGAEKPESRVEIGLRKVVDLLRPSGIKATFFVVGSVAEKKPEIVKLIRRSGHEVASHGYLHRPVSFMTKEEFREDLLKSINILNSITGKKVLGYRAPGYTITKDNLWALDIVKECGLAYDSTIYPVSLRIFTKGGVAGFPLGMFELDNGLREFPLTTLQVLGFDLPVATTSYFRILPYWMAKLAIRKLNNKGSVSTVNYHSWEFDPAQPRIKLPFPQNFKHYYNLARTEERFKRLITDFQFTSCAEMLDGAN